VRFRTGLDCHHRWRGARPICSADLLPACCPRRR
jgi:hypothetical protein